LGRDFLTEIELAISAAAERPHRYPRLRRHPEVRRVLLRRFPYRVFFVRTNDAVVVFRVLHGAEHDREWKSVARKQ
jgi:toxin ParE1/3/4